MQSKLDPTIVYEVNRGVAPHDYDNDADSWNYDDREVFRGARDPTYDSPHVFWLYDEDVQRVGVAEHDADDHSKFHVLWYYDCPFASFLQEDGWVATEETLWTQMSSRAYDYCIDRSLSSAEDVRKLCLRGTRRVVTPNCLISKVQTYPDITQVVFADEDCVLYKPPEGSKIWDLLATA